MSGNLWMFSDMLDDEDIEMLKRDFITYYQGADYYGLGLKVFTRMAREAGAVYKIGKKVLIRRSIFEEYITSISAKSLFLFSFRLAFKISSLFMSLPPLPSFLVIIIALPSKLVNKLIRRL